jgi:hypothetical protein
MDVHVQVQRAIKALEDCHSPTAPTMHALPPRAAPDDAPSRLDRDQLRDSEHPHDDDRSCVRFLRTSIGVEIATPAWQYGRRFVVMAWCFRDL